MQSIKFCFKQFTYEIYDRPGAWMTDEQLGALQERLGRVAEVRLGRRPRYSYFADVRCFKDKLITICSKEGRDLCFNAMAYIGTYDGRPAVHLGSVYSLEGQKGQMQMLYLWSSLYLLIGNGFGKIYITSITHTPRIFGAVQDGYSSVYPHAGLDTDQEPEPFHLEVRDLLMRSYLREFPLMTPPSVDEAFVLKGFRRMADGTVLIPDSRVTVPKHRNPEYNAFCLERLDYDNGDEILQVGIMKISNILKNGRIFRKGGRLRPLNVLRNIGRQLSGLAQALGRWCGPHPMSRRRLS